MNFVMGLAHHRVFAAQRKSIGVRNLRFDSSSGLEFFLCPTLATRRKTSFSFLSRLFHVIVNINMFFLLQDQAQLSQVVNFLCKLESPCDREETKEENKDTEVEETLQTEKEEEIEEVLVNVSELDVESFQHLVVSARSVAITRPSNLAKYTILPEQKTTDGKLRNRSVTTVLARFFCSYF